jgi:two-component system NtrC family sensor kinase
MGCWPAPDVSAGASARAAPRSLRTQLLVDLGFLTSAAVLLVGVTTAVLAGSDLQAAWKPLLALWAGSTMVFVVFGAHLVHRIVVAPLARLSAEADVLSRGDLSSPRPAYDAVELERLAERYRILAAELLDTQSHMLRVEKLASLGRLAAGVAHEVRNPLGALANYVEVLHGRGTDPAITVEMRRAVERIERIVQGLVDYARPGAADRGASSGPTDLNAAVGNVLDFLSAQGMLREHTVAVDLQPGLADVRGDRHQLEQVVVNLIANACQAAPGGRIVVGTAARTFEGRHAEAARRVDGDGRVPRERAWAPRPRPPGVGRAGAILYVADDGPGIPDADRDRVFDPFFTTKDPGEGTGLGLAIVARTVHESGGVVWSDRAREGGAVFKVFLPLAGETDAPAHR